MEIAKISLDTSAYTEFIKGKDDVIKYISSAIEIEICSIVLGELLYGFEYGSRNKLNNDILNQFLNRFSVKITRITAQTAKIYGAIKSSLRRNGNPIPENDVWIAASAIENKSTLISYDRHFRIVEGLDTAIIE